MSFLVIRILEVFVKIGIFRLFCQSFSFVGSIVVLLQYYGVLKLFGIVIRVLNFYFWRFCQRQGQQEKMVFFLIVESLWRLIMFSIKEDVVKIKRYGLFRGREIERQCLLVIYLWGYLYGYLFFLVSFFVIQKYFVLRSMFLMCCLEKIKWIFFFGIFFLKLVKWL